MPGASKAAHRRGCLTGRRHVVIVPAFRLGKQGDSGGRDALKPAGQQVLVFLPIVTMTTRLFAIGVSRRLFVDRTTRLSGFAPLRRFLSSYPPHDVHGMPSLSPVSLFDSCQTWIQDMHVGIIHRIYPIRFRLIYRLIYRLMYSLFLSTILLGPLVHPFIAHRCSHRSFYLFYSN